MSVTKVSQPQQEYIEAGRQTSVTTVNLSVPDTEKANKLAFNLIPAGIILISAGAGEIWSMALHIGRSVRRKHKKGDP